MPLHYELKSGDICEVLTSKKERGPSRDWLSLAKTTRAQSKIRAWFKRERREDSERTGREILQEALKRQGLPPQRIAGSPLLADVIREMGFRKGEDFYIALGQAKISTKVVVNKVMQRLKQGEAAVESSGAAEDLIQTQEDASRSSRPPRRATTASASRASTTCCCAWPSAAARCRATRSSATSRSARASRSTARTARTRRR